MMFPNSLAKPDEWRRAGAELGRFNLPAQPDGDAPVRTALCAVLAATHWSARDDYVTQVEALDAKRGNLMRQVHEVHSQTQTDPRQLGVLPALLGQRQAADRSRSGLHTRFVKSVHSITGEAELCDAAWRSGNERARDRRMTIAATQFVLPPGLLDPIPDPCA